MFALCAQGGLKLIAGVELDARQLPNQTQVRYVYVAVLFTAVRCFIQYNLRLLGPGETYSK